MNEDWLVTALQAQGLSADIKGWRASAADVTTNLARIHAGKGGAFIVVPACEPLNHGVWRTAFDAGFVPVRGPATHDVFLRSDLISDPSQLGGRTRGAIAMSSLGTNGRFANQLFQYAYLKFYGLRHACAVRASESWEGDELFGLTEQAIAPNTLAELRFYAFDNDDLALWENEAAPTDVDLWGYFQETPLCWTRHRALLRRLYNLREEFDQPITRAVAALTEDGRRPLIAAHMRRGDYMTLHREGLPWYRPVPSEWAVAWMDGVGKTEQRPVFYIATDDAAVLSAFKKFDVASASDFTGAHDISPALLDFEIMRRADHLALANSSFSRMAAMLAPAQQSCVIPDFDAKQMVAYQPWLDQAFWGRFENNEKASPTFGYSTEASLARSIMVRRDRGEIFKHERETEAFAQTMRVETARIWAENTQVKEALTTLRQDQFRFSEQTDQWIHERDMQIRSLAGALEAERENAAKLHALISRPAAAPPPATSLPRRLVSRAALMAVLVADCTLGAVSQRVRNGLAPIIVDLRAHRIGAFLRRCRDIIRRRPAAATPLTAALPINIPSYVAPKGAPTGLRGGWAFVECRDLGSAVFDLPNADFVVLGTTEPARASAETLCALLAAEPGLKGLRVGGGDTAVRVVRTQTLREIKNANVPIAHALDEPPDECGVIDPGFVGAPATSFRTEGLALGPDSHFWAIDPIGGSERLAAAYTPINPADNTPHLIVVMPWMTLGGSEIVFLDVLSHLAKSWRFTIVTTLRDDHVLQAKFRAITEDIVLAGDLFDQERIAALIVALCHSRGACAILSSNSSLLHDRAPEIAAALPHIKLYDILHNDLPGGHIEGAANASTSLTRHIAVSTRVGAALQARGVPGQRISVIANGVDTDLFAPRADDRTSARGKLGVPADMLLLAFIGRLSNEKRPSSAIEIAALVNRATPTRLVIVGEGPLEDEVRDQARAHRQLVSFLPPMSRDAVCNIYRAADCLILPSTIEGMPLSALEALSTGCPVAATDVGELAAVIKTNDNGFLAPVETPLKLADAILASRPRLQAMREAARSSITTSGRNKAAMLQQYEDVLASALIANAGK